MSSSIFRFVSVSRLLRIVACGPPITTLDMTTSDHKCNFPLSSCGHLLGGKGNAAETFAFGASKTAVRGQGQGKIQWYLTRRLAVLLESPWTPGVQETSQEPPEKENKHICAGDEVTSDDMYLLWKEYASLHCDPSRDDALEQHPLLSGPADHAVCGQPNRYSICIRQQSDVIDGVLMTCLGYQ